MPKPDSLEQFQSWKRDVDNAMLQEFAINTVDAGLSDEELSNYWQQEPSATAFVAWYGEKYDLTPVADWKWQSSALKI